MIATIHIFSHELKGFATGHSVGVAALIVWFVLVCAGVAISLSIPKFQRRQMAAELRRDWWPGFERQFRAHAKRALRNPKRRRDE